MFVWEFRLFDAITSSCLTAVTGLQATHKGDPGNETEEGDLHHRPKSDSFDPMTPASVLHLGCHPLSVILYWGQENYCGKPNQIITISEKLLQETQPNYNEVRKVTAGEPVNKLSSSGEFSLMWFLLQVNSRSLRLGANRRAEILDELTAACPVILQLLVRSVSCFDTRTPVWTQSSANTCPGEQIYSHS